MLEENPSKDPYNSFERLDTPLKPPLSLETPRNALHRLEILEGLLKDSEASLTPQNPLKHLEMPLSPYKNQLKLLQKPAEIPQGFILKSP